MYYHEWLNEWLSSFVRPAVKERTYKKYFQEIQRYILPSIGKLKIEDLSARILQQFVTELSNGGLSSRSEYAIPPSKCGMDEERTLFRILFKFLL